ncbi:MAG: tyrosine-type recombinase/integrase, partial [Lachnospiraceae bacterium]|nr:tyrosine-type recombinase/integrase [Lachnospiraceae bacterium]
KTDGMKLLMEQISTDSISGLRDYVMLTIMYTTGIRVSELIGIKAKDLSLSDPPTLLVHGKGGRDRYVPINKKTVSVIRKYISAMNYEAHERLENPLFVNHMGNCFTRQGVNYMIDKYAEMARRKSSELIPNDMSPHKIRHSTAMSLVASGVDLIYIRDLLGHSSVKTTEIYARADAQLKRKAIEAASKELVISEKAEWDTNTSLKEWLINFCRPI